MEHDVEVTRTHNERSEVPDALHLRCACGWTSSAHTDEEARELVRAHVDSGVVPAPPPYVPSPD